MSTSQNNTANAQTNLDTEIGRIVLDAGLATRDELDICRGLQKESAEANQRSLADLLVENEFITPNQAKRIRKQAAESRRKSHIPGYELLSEVGRGAMARVYKARQLSLDRIVAIKILPPKMGESAEFVERFYKEGRAAARLSHNNIVQAIDVGQAPEGYHYFVMEFIEGYTLYDLMAAPPAGQGKVFTEEEALDIMIQMADALVHAHARNLIHRDVKPKNIILTPAGVAKLTDLGLARASDDTAAAASEAGKAYGTPYYISPEQIRGDMDIDFRADIYSLGATMYHLVTGRPPFDGETPTAVMHKHLKQALVPADHVNTSLSAGTGEIIEMAMAKNRDERYQSMADMLEDLQAVRRGEPATHAHREVDLSQLGKLAETGTTVDIGSGPSAAPSASIWSHPAAVALLSVAGISVLVNLILLIMMFMRK